MLFKNRSDKSTLDVRLTPKVRYPIYIKARYTVDTYQVGY